MHIFFSNCTAVAIQKILKFPFFFFTGNAKNGNRQKNLGEKNVGKEKINVMNGPLPKRVSFFVAPMKQLIIRVKVLYIIF